MNIDPHTLSDREWALRDAAIKWSHGERVQFPDPSHPTPIEKHYLSAIAYFSQKRMVMGFESFELGDHRAYLRHARARKARR